MPRQTRTSESGFTLIELLVAVTVSGLIISALAAGFLVTMRGTAGAHERFAASNAAQTFAAHFTSDVQSADPTLIRTDAVGTGCAASPADSASSNVVRLQWAENTGTTRNFSASYRMQQSGTEWQLVRYFCSYVGSPTGPTSHVVARDLDAPGQRFSDGVTNGTTTLTSATAAFDATKDIGLRLTGTNIPAGATVASITNATTAVMSLPATGSGSSTFTIGRQVRVLTDGVTTSGSKNLTAGSGAFGPGDVGRALTGLNIPKGTTIASVTNPTTAVMTQAASASGSTLTVGVGAPYAVAGPNAIAPAMVTVTLSGVKATSDNAPYSYSLTATIRSPFPPPLVSSITPCSTCANPTNGSSVQWTVAFSRAVTGVDSTDFVLVKSVGITGELITAVASNPTGDIYTVTANAGTGDGTLALKLEDNDSVIDAATSKKLGGAGTANGNFTGDAYTVDRTAPTVVVRQKIDPDDATNNQADPTGSQPIYFTVEFSEPVEEFDGSDVSLAGSTAGVAGAIKTVTGSREDYELAVTGLSGGGDVVASVPAGGAKDAAGNASLPFLASDTTTDHTVTYNALPPTTTSVTSSMNPTVVGQAVTYTATVSGVPGPPTGKVVFYDGGVAIAACGGTGGQNLVGDSASCTVTYPTVGGRTITAEYLGDANYSSSVSGPLTQAVNAGPPVITISNSGGSGHREIYGGTTTANSGSLTVKVYLGATATGTAVKTYTTSNFVGSGSSYTWQIAPPANNELTFGLTYTAEAIHVDGSGGTSSPKSITFTAH